MTMIQDKDQQKKLIIEIMEADEKDGLYDSGISKMETTQTAVEWLVEQIKNEQQNQEPLSAKEWMQVIEQAKQMEKEQITDSYIMGSYDMAEKEFRPEQYYNETYKK